MSKYKVPFYVKLAHHGGTFHDMASGLEVSGDRVSKVTNLTPTTQHWLREGGLVVVTAEGGTPSAEEPEAKPPAKPNGGKAKVTATPKVETPAPDATDANQSKDEPDGDGEDGEGADDGVEPNLDDLLKEGEEAGKPINPNAKCPCKSDKKYKNCCGKAV